MDAPATPVADQKIAEETPWGNATDNLTLSLPGYAGDLAFAFRAHFSSVRSCDLTFGGAGPTSADEPVGDYYSYTSADSWNFFGMRTKGDTIRLHTGPVDTRPAMNQVRETVSFLNPSGSMSMWNGFEMDGWFDVRIAGDAVVPHAELGDAGLLVDIQCDGPFRWGDLRAGTSVVSMIPANFEGTGLHVGAASHDAITTLGFELNGGTVHGFLWDGGATVETGSLKVTHPGGEDEWTLPGESPRTFSGVTGAYQLTLERTTIDPGSLFALVFDTTQRVPALETLSPSEF